MPQPPIVVDIPHSLGAEEARRRIDANLGSLAQSIPGAANVQTRWTGDVLRLSVSAMSQQVDCDLDVRASFVRVSVVLPPALSFFRQAVEAGLRSRGAALLEDNRR